MAMQDSPPIRLADPEECPVEGAWRGHLPCAVCCDHFTNPGRHGGGGAQWNYGHLGEREILRTQSAVIAFQIVPELFARCQVDAVICDSESRRLCEVPNNAIGVDVPRGINEIIGHF